VKWDNLTKEIMSKVKTKELVEEVSNYIRTKMSFNVEYDGGSDYDRKYIVNTLNPNFWDENRKPKEDERKVVHHITFSVNKHYKTERFLIWDKRVKQPFFNSKFCDYKGSFGRYEFNNKEDFYKHIESDFGMDEIEEWYFKRNQKKVKK
jgi:hypothetical protein